MDHSLFETFKRLKNAGLRAQAAVAIRAFLDSFESFDEKAAWTRWYLENAPPEHKVRHELYERVVFPVLLDGYRRRDPWSLRWLARTSQNLYSASNLSKQVDHKSEFAFRIELVELCPDDEVARKDLLRCILEWFRHAVYEWPACILDGMDGADLEQCRGIAEMVARARSLDHEGTYSDLLSDFESKLMEYQARLMQRDSEAEEKDRS